MLGMRRRPQGKTHFLPFHLPALVALLVGTACATGYSPRGLLGAGFAERRLAPGVWLVTFDGSVFTPKDRLQRYLLLRCAEITVENGAGYFSILGDGTYIRPRSSKPRLLDQSPFPLDDSPGQPRIVSPRSALAEIQIYTDKPEEKAYDARELIRRLSQKT